MHEETAFEAIEAIFIGFGADTRENLIVLSKGLDDWIWSLAR